MTDTAICGENLRQNIHTHHTHTAQRMSKNEALKQEKKLWG
jgi:hypothetical protein